MMQFDVLQLRGDQLSAECKRLVCDLLREAAPQPEELSDEELLQAATFCHDEADCTWLLLRVWKQHHGTATLPTSASTQHRSSWDPHKTVIGIATGAAHSRSFYLFNLAVRRSYRRLGCGAKLVRECQVLAARLGLSCGSGSVSSSDERLLRWYGRFGASVANTFASSSGKLPPTVTMEAHFDPADAERALAAADAALHENLNRNGHQRTLRLAVVSGAVLLMGVVAAKLLARRSW